MSCSAHRARTSILEEFLSDPKTTNLAACDKQRQSLHVAVIVMRGKILASATNRNGSRSSGSGYSSHSIHAEKNVIKQLGDISKLRGADLYVMRISRDHKKTHSDKFLYSKPCDECQIFLEKCMKEYGLKNVYFTA
jgi:Cytidine and deoxycytidylate deaminase zinc-binding region